MLCTNCIMYCVIHFQTVKLWWNLEVGMRTVFEKASTTSTWRTATESSTWQHGQEKEKYCETYFPGSKSQYHQNVGKDQRHWRWHSKSPSGYGLIHYIILHVPPLYEKCICMCVMKDNDDVFIDKQSQQMTTTYSIIKRSDYMLRNRQLKLCSCRGHRGALLVQRCSLCRIRTVPASILSGALMFSLHKDVHTMRAKRCALYRAVM